MVDLQKEDAITKEPVSPKLFVESATQTQFARDGIQKRDVVTQEPTFPKLLVETAT